MEDEPHDRDDEHARVEEIVARGPLGAFAIAAAASAIVVLLYLAFYLLIYLPRGAVQ